jgi:hypothetical protein
MRQQAHHNPGITQIRKEDEHTQCTYGLSEQSVEHVLQECPLYYQLRGMYWPNGSALHSKPYGARKVHQKTVEFIKETLTVLTS